MTGGARWTTRVVAFAVVRGLLGTLVHEWAERRSRWLTTFFDAAPVGGARSPVPGDEGVEEVRWPTRTCSTAEESRRSCTR
ncbi:hypothetical protein [Kineosporia sp. R_H_3]|uniref:hypothetical protein n=1 Tax=Kineosporia sp. R_H_3 TaxID=1961848 RepID=UPI000B4B81E4|nr:hypothetical protein [Kineosporia sp. R_H_3]